LHVLREEGFEIEGFFYNPNIHPFREFQERLRSYQMLVELKGLKTYCIEDYGLETFINELKVNQLSIDKRCPLCYRLRLEAAADKAKELGMEGYTTTLLVSPYQNHELLAQTGKEIGEAKGIPFIYRDFRPGFRQGQQEARQLGLYMQSYCGCVFSEYDRYKPKNKGKM